MEETRTFLVRKYKEKNTSASISLYENYEDLISAPNVDLIMITTPQYVHRGPAICALQSGKKVFLDKPIAHNLEDAIAIFEAEVKTNNPMIMGFTRRYESVWLKMFALLNEGVIGELQMMLIRVVVPYHIYFHTWHRRVEWSGGVLGDKSSHLFDVFNWFSGGRPERMSAFGGRAVFLPDANSPKRCRQCELDCPYRVGKPEEKARQDDMSEAGASRAKETEVIRRDDNCVYLPGADINDHGIVNFAYPNGIKASLFWAIFGPDADDQETLELVGSKGRIILTRHTGKIDIISDYGKHHEVVDGTEKDFTSSHFGADFRLVMELNKFFKGAAPVASGRDGLEATRMVEAAHRSINSGGRLVLMKDIEDAQL